MPSTYAHYRFGQDVLKALPDQYKKVLLQEEDLFTVCTVLICCFTIILSLTIRCTLKAAACTGSPAGSISQRRERFI